MNSGAGRAPHPTQDLNDPVNLDADDDDLDADHLQAELTEICIKVC